MMKNYEQNHNQKSEAKSSFTVVENPKIKKCIAVMSGKGGVGKSMVTALLATFLAYKNQKVGILDADITGPSIPRMFGVADQRAVGGRLGTQPVKSRLGIEIMSLNFLLEAEDNPVIWRGPLISRAVRQFWEEVAWGELDYLFIDLPPGTADIPLTVMQSLPVDGFVIVCSPQDLVMMIVRKAINMAGIMNKRILGLVENMSYFVCPSCGDQLYPFGKGKSALVAERLGIPFIGEIPLDTSIAKICDSGKIEEAKNLIHTSVLFYLSNMSENFIKSLSN